MMTADEASGIEEQLGRHPDRAVARARLLGYYLTQIRQVPVERSIQSKRLEHILWFVSNRPGSAFVNDPACTISPRQEGYERVADQWRGLGQKDDPGAVAYENAILFFLRSFDLPTVMAMVEEARERHPDVDEFHLHWVHARLRSLLRVRDPADYVTGLSDIATEIDASLQGELSFHVRVIMLLYRTHISMDLQQLELATELLAKADEALAAVDVESRIFHQLEHHLQTVRGRVALAADDLASARNQLIGSANEKSRASLGSYGPNLSLAEELLEHDAEAVVEFLSLWEASQWYEREDVAGWIQRIEAGEPVMFEASLVPMFFRLAPVATRHHDLQ